MEITRSAIINVIHRQDDFELADIENTHHRHSNLPIWATSCSQSITETMSIELASSRGSIS